MTGKIVADQSTPKPKAPEHFRDGPVKATVWTNERESGTYHTVEVSRSYKDRETGEWRDTAKFNAGHLTRLKAVIDRSANYIADQKRDPAKDREAYVQRQQEAIKPQKQPDQYRAR